MPGNPCDGHSRRSSKRGAKGDQTRHKRRETAFRLFPFPGPTCLACWRPLSRRNGNAHTELAHPSQVTKTSSLPLHWPKCRGKGLSHFLGRSCGCCVYG